MRYFFKGTVKFIVSNIAVVFTIMLLPVFLITDTVPVFDELMSFLFDNHNT
ncbi:hypothetical protein [Lentibacillus salicampi]|uniref:hypothetical protein n=1 Tax=Lentibacillus salicampi TaxID=175306 RepID=UPI001431B85F|nr:hypothetical protein [Lentibacillus salicampi]